MTIRASLLTLALTGVLLVTACGEPESGPVVVSAIGEPPQLLNPNLKPLDAPSAFLIDATAQGLVRFDAGGQVEPALAQSWIVSDDGLRYTFRLARAEWANGGRVTARQVVDRLRAAISPASRNPYKPLLNAIDEIEPMTGDVLEISLKGPRPNFLQILAQPELGIIHRGAGSGHYRAENASDGSIRLGHPHSDTDVIEEMEAELDAQDATAIVLRGENAAWAVARFAEDRADYVTGGTIGDLPIARAANLGGNSLRFDPAAGLFGLAFTRDGGLFGDAAARRALSMAIDRADLVAALDVPDLQPRESVVSPDLDDGPAPALPSWSESPAPMRRELAQRTLAGLAGGKPVVVRVALPPGLGYRTLFAHLKRDWRAIGVEAQRVGLNEQADLRLVDAVAPTADATAYLRAFSCDVSAVCDAEADEFLATARAAPTPAEREAALAQADRLITAAGLFIPIAAPVRWSLVSPRLAGFQPNVFARRFPGSLVPAKR